MPRSPSTPKPHLRKKPPIKSFSDVLSTIGPRLANSPSQAEKKNYAESFSRATATWLANSLRVNFPKITPNADGGEQESLARTEQGFKRLDINYSTLQLGLALGISIKSIHYPDARSGNFVKNFSRNDAELRAEASDYHRRQPYAVLIAVLFLPIESCVDGDDSKKSPSSFGKAVHYFRRRGNRQHAKDDIEKFERFFIATYTLETASVRFFDTNHTPPRNRTLRPDEGLDLPQFVQEIIAAYNARNTLDEHRFVD